MDVPRKKVTTARGVDLKKYDAYLDQAGMHLAYILDSQDGPVA